MNNLQQFKVGDKIVECGIIYRIFKIKNDKVLSGNKEKRIFYKPYFKTTKTPSLICSVLENNIEEANLRRPSSRKKIEETLKILSKKPRSRKKINLKDVDEYIRENDPKETARLLKHLWEEKQVEEKKLATRKKTFYQNAMKSLIEEISIVQNIGLKKANNKVRSCLKKVCPEKKMDESSN